MNRLLNRWQLRFGRYAIHNLMMYVCSTMLAVYFLQYMLYIPVISWLDLSRNALLHGEVWRLNHIYFYSAQQQSILAAVQPLFLLLHRNSLEGAWGSFRFNIYYLFGMLFAIAAALITGYGSNQWLNLSLFLAFAQLFPDSEFLIFFVLPVKAKYLAYVDWVLFALGFLFGGWSNRITILFAIANFLLFLERTLLIPSATISGIVTPEETSGRICGDGEEIPGKEVAEWTAAKFMRCTAAIPG